MTGNTFTDTTSSNIQRGLLYSFVNDGKVYRCPSDRSTVLNAGKIPRTRHYGMSVYMSGMGNSATFSEWTVEKLICRKQTSIQDPGPAKAFVFIDSHPGNIAGGSFSVSQLGSSDDLRWTTFPGARHQTGANLSFADGHVEHWRWREAKSIYWEKNKGWGGGEVNKGDRDLRRLQGCIPQANP